MNPIPKFLNDYYQSGAIDEATFNRVTKKFIYTSEYDYTPDVLLDDVREVLELPKCQQVSMCERKAFWKVSTVYCGTRNDNSFLVALKKIGEKEGFDAKEHPICSDWVRDCAYPLSSDALLVPAFLTEEKMSEIKFQALKITPITPKRKKWNHLGFLGNPMTNFAYGKFDICSSFPRYDIQIKLSNLYFQGGNMLKAENKEGTHCQLVGAYNILASHLLLNEQVAMITDLFQKNLPGRCIFLGLEHFEQMAYHLDISLMPLMGAKVLVQDHDESVRLLEKLLAHPEIKKDEKEHFSLYLQDARELAELDRPKLARLKKELTETGFEPIAISGNYYSDGVGKVNFINGVHGYGSNNNSFAITLDYATPGEKYLRGYFTHTLHQHGVQTYITYHQIRPQKCWIAAAALDAIHYIFKAFFP